MPIIMLYVCLINELLLISDVFIICDSYFSRFHLMTSDVLFFPNNNIKNKNILHTIDKNNSVGIFS